jgi:uncharacterized protein YjeT (DUF2065 family)
MRIDKFGVLALVFGLVVFFATLHFGFFGGGTTLAGWTWPNFVNAVVTTILGGLILFGLAAIVIGILLLVL